MAQVHPVVSRLCAPIEGTDAARLADCLSLDPAKFQGSSAAAPGLRDALEDALLASTATLDSDSRYKARLPVPPAGPAARPLFCGLTLG